jgi:hypothetical protein
MEVQGRCRLTSLLRVAVLGHGPRLGIMRDSPATGDREFR